MSGIARRAPPKITAGWNHSPPHRKDKSCFQALCGGGSASAREIGWTGPSKQAGLCLRPRPGARGKSGSLPLTPGFVGQSATFSATHDVRDYGTRVCPGACPSSRLRNQRVPGADALASHEEGRTAGVHLHCGRPRRVSAPRMGENGKPDHRRTLGRHRRERRRQAGDSRPPNPWSRSHLRIGTRVAGLRRC